jgi:hypothetical protein
MVGIILLMGFYLFIYFFRVGHPSALTPNPFLEIVLGRAVAKTMMACKSGRERVSCLCPF